MVRSEELRKALQKVHKQKATGYLSVTGQEGTKQVYGTLHLLKGKLVKAEYANLTGSAAVDMMSTLSSPVVSFAPSPIEDTGGESLPEITTLMGSTQAAKGAKAARATKKSSAKGGFKIFPQVLLTMFLVSLVPLAGLWFINNLRVQQTVRENVELNLRKTSQTVASQVEDWIDKTVRTGRQATLTPEMQSMEPTRVKPQLVAALATNEWTEIVNALDAEGFAVARADGKALKDYSTRSYYQQTVQNNGLGSQVVIGKTSGKPTWCLSLPINRTTELVGVMVQCSNLNAISESIADVRIGETGYMFLIDDAGNLVASGDESFLNVEQTEFTDFSDNPAVQAGIVGEQFTYEANGKEVLAYAQNLPLGWTLVVQQDAAEAFAPLRSAQRSALIILVATVLFVVIVALLMARRLVTPIESLTEAAENMSRGQLGEEISETERGDEIGSLARAVERMGVSIKMAFEELNGSQEGAR